MKKTALITGSSKGIGKELSLLLLEKSYTVFGYSRTNSIRHKNFHFNQIDLSSIQNLESINFPKVEEDEHVCLINNAGEIGEIDKFGNKRTNDIINEFNLNTVAPSILSNSFIRSFQDQSNHPIIINISSGAALRPIESWGTYCQSKAALDMLTKIINQEHNSIKAYSIYPGVVDTEMQKKIRDTDIEKFALKDVFVEYFRNNELVDPKIISKKIYHILSNLDLFEDNMISLRDLSIK
ncbi:MAG: SDR family NAD(P)-dependent oxidoreductase [Pelagibacterales bacterium]|nr:SDR family NAD(P)-dependent oxidoreductase [Pelagibacterales bacterium]